MPAKNSVKIYVENGHYHIYNRGVEKRVIFEDEQDYKVFLNYLKEYLSPPPNPEEISKIQALQGGSLQSWPRQHKNYEKEIDLIAYCLMPNHFHLIVKQSNKISMEGFMRSLATRYSMYFNKKYDRVGKLFQGHYKASFIGDENYLLHLTRYVHLNPSEHTSNLIDTYSSYGDYLGVRHTPWVKPEVILSYFDQAKSDFKRVNSYKDFIEKFKKDSEILLEGITLEN